ncbi:type 1 glutamine amidotransferase [Chthonobacter albigriseus]|uniref:type 1 glutamine amidotransferase n=1 Tax=Chthonobacter albigriseus TaxID=1683161 RepID=UPI0015EEAD6F|nr:type 1 glutamine amidotransferase [Chthonobacter albigriseus]
MTKRILAVENFPGTHLGLVGQALREAGADVDVCLMHGGHGLPETPDGYDGLVVLGGGQNALADEAHPYLPHLARLTTLFGEEDKAVLGICLGSQIVARGYGGRNILGRPAEFGWKEVRPTDAGRDDPLVSRLGSGSPLFHWHNDTFDLPPGAVRLASSDQTVNQAFRIGRAVYGIQFHFEADTVLVAEWCAAYRDMLRRDAPGWEDKHHDLAATLGVVADRVGLEIARAWVELV